MFDPFFGSILEKSQANWRLAVSLAIQAGVAVPAFGASLAYFDSYRQERLPANLLQAQRDYFGAHTYERIDKPGTFHTRVVARAEVNHGDLLPVLCFQIRSAPSSSQSPQNIY